MMQTIQDTLAMIKYGVSHAAALIYHDVVAIETDVIAWTADHPTLAPLFKDGVELALQAIRRTGFSVDSLSLVATDIVAAVRGMAALDNSVVGVQAVQDMAMARTGSITDEPEAQQAAEDPKAADPKVPGKPGKKP